MNAGPELRILENGRELAAEAADLFVWLGNQAIPNKGRFRVALSGGSTPTILHRALATPDLAKQVDWTKVEFFFGDERGVPPDHPESNFGMADATLFRPLGVKPDRIFRMHGEAKDQEQAAREYEAVLHRQFGTKPPAWPHFDLILLGLGEDGHTASLFPGSEALHERTRLVVPSRSPKRVPQRLTLTVPIVNQAQTVVFLVSGAGKAAVVRQVLEGRETDRAQLPAQLIRPEQGRLIWFLDQAAASELALSKQGLVSHEE
ncbi:MAG: 6-phosphogluconolactonase [Nitrospirae bacterium]|nr:MAG: 6-phosphogluconolactonase [Nitrospirota bacterium]